MKRKQDIDTTCNVIKTSKLKLNLNKKNIYIYDCHLFRRETPLNTGQLIFMHNDRYTFSPCSAAKLRREIRNFAAEFRGEIPR